MVRSLRSTNAPRRRPARWLPVLAGALCLASCAPEETAPASHTPEQKEAIAAAARAVRQYEDWAEKAEYKIQKHSSGWQVTAWRVEHPEATGNARYLPWGYRVILIDRRGQVAEYKNSR